MNRTINEYARSMRLYVGLPKTLWTNAINIAIYLIDRGPLVSLEYRLSEEVWSENEVKLTHLKVFGCVSTYTLILMIIAYLMSSQKCVSSSVIEMNSLAIDFG